MALDEKTTAEIEEAVDAEVAETNEESGFAETNEESESTGTSDSGDAADDKTGDVKDDAGSTAEKEDEAVVSAGDGDAEVDDDAVTKEKEAADAEKHSVPSLAAAVVERAIRVGISLEDAQSYPNEQVLASACDLIEKKAAAGESDEEAEDRLAALESLDPEQYEPEVIEMFGVLAGEIREQRAQVAALKAEHEQSAKANQSAVSNEVVQWFDGKVGDLGDDYVKALGKGSHDSLDKASPEYAKREAIAEQIAIMLAGYTATKRPVPARDEMFKRAVNFVLHDEVVAANEKKLKGDLRKRASQHLSRGSSSKGKADEKSAAEETAALIDEKYGKE